MDNLRKRAAEASGDPEPRDGPDDTAGFDSISDDGWLVGVERRDSESESESYAPMAGVFPDQTPGPRSADAEPINADSGFNVSSSPAPALESSEQPSTQPSASSYPNLGMVYAGLDETGVSMFPPEDQVESGPLPLGLFPPEELSEASRGIESGPIGPEAAIHLATLDLSVGCTWDDVTVARRNVLDALTDGSAESWNKRLEVNHAYASLRLLRVGPLKL
jgi:hypothetical protein